MYAIPKQNESIEVKKLFEKMTWVFLWCLKIHDSWNVLNWKNIKAQLERSLEKQVKPQKQLVSAKECKHFLSLSTLTPIHSPNRNLFILSVNISATSSHRLQEPINFLINTFPILVNVLVCFLRSWVDWVHDICLCPLDFTVSRCDTDSTVF